MGNEKIRYFSMFTGVGGFELGIERANNVRGTSEKCYEDERNKSSSDESNGGGRRSCSNNSQSSPKIKQDGERGNGIINKQGTLLCNRSIPTFSCVGFSEIDKFSSELLKQKFPGIKNYGDATKIIPKELPDFDFLVGGFPCQAFSIAGKRKGFEDTRGTLFYDIARILKVKRPGNILLENVKGLLSHNRGKTFATILATLSELGYVVQWVVLNSKFFGVPQNRERVFIIGSLRGKSIPEILPFGENVQNINETSEKQMEGSNTLRAGYWKGGSGTHIQVKGYLNEHRWDKRNESIRRIYGTEGIAPTIPTAQGGGVMTKVIQHNMKIRRLTPLECERLQGFPDGWTKGFSDTQRYKMMGNAVTVNVIETVINKMFASPK